MFKNPKSHGLITLIVKVNFLIAGITLFKLPPITVLFLSIPLHQVVAIVIFMVLIYMELKPYFSRQPDAKQRKSKKKSAVEEAGLDYLEA